MPPYFFISAFCFLSFFEGTDDGVWVIYSVNVAALDETIALQKGDMQNRN